VRKTLIVAAVLALAGCGDKGAGVGVTSSQSSTTEQAGLIERVKSMLFDKSTTASVQIPVAPIIIQAIIASGLDGNFVRSTQVNFCPSFIPGNLAHAKKSDLSSPSYAKSIYGDMLKTILAYPHKPEDVREMEEAVRRSEKYSFSDAQKWCLSYLAERATKPVIGWPSLNRDFREMEAKIAMISTFSTNYIAAEIAGSLTKKIHDNPDDIKSAALKLLDDMAKSGEIELAIELADNEWESVKDQIFYDGINTNPPVHFTVGKYDIAGDGTGYRMSHSGMVWFGNGNLSGKKYEVGVVRTASSALGKSSTVTDSQSGSAEHGIDSGVSVGK
jgi:hypothetical protein